MPWLGSRYDTFLATQIAIDALFAVSLNLLLGTTGLVVVRRMSPISASAPMSAAS